MTTLVRDPGAVESATLPSWRIVRALAVPEGRRLLRAPLLWLGLALSGLMAWSSLRVPAEWSGVYYTGAPALVGPVLVVISMLVAGSFHRERTDLASDAPVGEGVRTGGLLLGASSLVGLVAILTAIAGTLARWHGGFDLGDEPGRTLHAHFTVPELLQPVALAVLAVAVGAAAGRRLRHRATATLVLFVAWFPMITAPWLLQDRQVTPFSVIQIQPVSIPIGPVSSDPSTFPSDWLLSQPGEYQDHWARAFLSAPLAGWHLLWLLGLACLFVAVAVPRRGRPALLAVGAVAAVVAVVAQYAVIP
jgi:hypothetical protein